jgi:hypothetical protein
MSDEVFTIKLTAREIDLIQQCISTNIETVKRRHDPTDGMIAELLTELSDLSIDLLEQFARPGEWSADLDPTDIDGGMSGRTFSVAESDFVDHGIRAREMQKSQKVSSQAAARRNFNLKNKDPRLSKTQTHDVWDANDPKNW